MNLIDLSKLKKIVIGVKNLFHHNKKSIAKQKAIAGENNNNNQIADSITNVHQAQPQIQMIKSPMIGKQAKLWFNEQMKCYGCPNYPLTFQDQIQYNNSFLDEVDTARNEFIKWCQDHSENGVYLPPYKEMNTKAKKLWDKYVKTQPNFGDDLNS